MFFFRCIIEQFASEKSLEIYIPLIPELSCTTTDPLHIRGQQVLIPNVLIALRV